ncbi:hypothetical protein GUJ93_ZPchr0010g10423 [Zizania palustris]|uniref:Uncharacterized protein n=1 Tax=Zizania palustris TaxID=103762 RepID=A0A8J5W8P6_ZIZPA|nr:hypothetical protein GUJ93_ZPchr0010g10423 [Zizania palustris]
MGACVRSQALTTAGGRGRGHPGAGDGGMREKPGADDGRREQPSAGCGGGKTAAGHIAGLGQGTYPERMKAGLDLARGGGARRAATARRRRRVRRSGEEEALPFGGQRGRTTPHTPSRAIKTPPPSYLKATPRHPKQQQRRTNRTNSDPALPPPVRASRFRFLGACNRPLQALQIAVKDHSRECRKMCLHARVFSCEEEGISPIGFKSLILDERGFQVHTWCIFQSQNNNDAINVRNTAMLDHAISDDG